MFISGEYNSDQDAASLAYGKKAFYYDYEGRQIASVEQSNNETAHSQTNIRRIFNYKQVNT